MFLAVWSLTYGPTWLRVVQILALIAVVVAVMVLFVYPAILEASLPQMETRG